MYQSDKISVHGPLAIGQYCASPRAGMRRRLAFPCGNEETRRRLVFERKNESTPRLPARGRGIILLRGKATPCQFLEITRDNLKLITNIQANEKRNDTTLPIELSSEMLNQYQAIEDYSMRLHMPK
ncbi:hypothetical protein GW17_00026041 [Ensete ventricosum]|nr:hypothetical protein GW17_00026041 [Ensete ventricosum]RZS10842.1 hypothetical protein BHM03_00042112 [Ensete ventricosum]